jgi:hypothetical protein
MIKRKFGEALKSKIHEGQVNEVLCVRSSATNLCSLISAIYELEMPTFGGNASHRARLPAVWRSLFSRVVHELARRGDPVRFRNPLCRPGVDPKRPQDGSRGLFCTD